MRRVSVQRVFLLTGLIFIIIVGCGQAGTEIVPPFAKSYTRITASDYFAQVRSEELSSWQAPGKDQISPAQFDINEEKEEEVIKGKKNGLKAFLLSLAVPGAGQWYNGSKLKAAVFGSIEIAGWYARIHYESVGDDRTDLFENWADSLWSEADYRAYLDLWDIDEADLTHELPSTKTQQYYEMIGKYDQFVYGWDDVEPTLDNSTPTSYIIATSAHRMTYEQMKKNAEIMYDRSRAAIIVIMINHVLAASEAAWSAKRHNDRLEELAQRLSFKARLVRIDENRVPMLTVSYKF